MDRSIIYDCSKYAQSIGGSAYYYIYFDYRSVYIIRVHIDPNNTDESVLDTEMLSYYPDLQEFFINKVRWEQASDDWTFIEQMAQIMGMPQVLKTIVDCDKARGFSGRINREELHKPISHILTHYVLRDKTLSSITI